VDSLRFEIAKQLKISPTYGYDLFQILSKRNLVENSADLYKILRSMKSSRLLNFKTIDTKHGQKKELLSLSNEGLKFYYDRIAESIKITMNLILELNYRHIQKNIFKILEDLNIDLLQGQPRSILIENQYLPLPMQIQFITVFFESTKNFIILYVKTDPKSEQAGAEWDSLIKNGYQIKIMDLNMSIKPHSIDAIISFGQNMAQNFKNLLDPNNPDSWNQILTENGIVFIPFIREIERDKTSILFDMFRSLFDELPEELQDVLFSEFQYMISSPKLFSKAPKNQVLFDNLSLSFEEVLKIPLIDLYELFIAKKPK
jgi:DNA-binding PadR family transcriptional regulator